MKTKLRRLSVGMGLGTAALLVSSLAANAQEIVAKMPCNTECGAFSGCEEVKSQIIDTLGQTVERHHNDYVEKEKLCDLKSGQGACAQNQYARIELRKKRMKFHQSDPAETRNLLGTVAAQVKDKAKAEVLAQIEAGELKIDEKGACASFAREFNKTAQSSQELFDEQFKNSHSGDRALASGNSCIPNNQAEVTRRSGNANIVAAYSYLAGCLYEERVEALLIRHVYSGAAQKDIQKKVIEPIAKTCEKKVRDRYLSGCKKDNWSKPWKIESCVLSRGDSLANSCYRSEVEPRIKSYSGAI